MKFEDIRNNIINPSEDIPEKLEKELEDSDKVRVEYLKPGIPRIMSCIGTPAQFIKTEESHSEFSDFYSKNDVPEGYDIVDVNYTKAHEDLESEGFKNPKTYSYVISPIDNLQKISKNFMNCLGFLAVGYKRNRRKYFVYESSKSLLFFIKSQSIRILCK